MLPYTFCHPNAAIPMLVLASQCCRPNAAIILGGLELDYWTNKHCNHMHIAKVVFYDFLNTTNTLC